MLEKALIHKLYKNLGETPLECIHRFKDAHPEYAEERLTYLGRLDPMAEGLLLVAPGRVKKEEYLALDKSYEFEVLWGFKSDSYDILGLVSAGDLIACSQTRGKFATNKIPSLMKELLRKIKSKTTQEYPPYSSRTVSGKALFLWAREDKIEEIDIPTRSIKIFNIEHIHTRLIGGKDLLEEVLSKIAKVGGDFRQEKIVSGWKNALIARPREDFLISKFRADVSSGTYIRGLASEMGKILDTGALAWSIKRTRVGEFKI